VKVSIYCAKRPWEGTHLVGGLVELLGVEGSTDAEGDALAEEDVVGDSSDTAVVDLGLFWVSSAYANFLAQHNAP